MRLTRRRLLSVAGAAGLGTGLSGCSSPVSAPGSDPTTTSGVRSGVDPGTTLWTYDFEGGPTVPLVTSAGVCVGVDSELIQLTPEGEVDWRVSADEPFQPRFLQVGDRVLAASGEYGGFGGASNVVVHAVTADGDREWREPVDSGSHLSLLGGGGGVVYAGTSDDAIERGSGHHLYALSLGDGTVEWQEECGDLSGGQGVATDDALYLFDGPVEAYAPGGEHLWETDRSYERPLWDWFDAERDQLYAVAQPSDGDDSHIYALSLDGGEELWDAPIQDTPDDATRHGDHVVVTGYDGIYAVSRSDGSITWEEPFSGSATTAVGDEAVYVATSATTGDGETTIRALDLADGEELWSQSPSVVEEILGVGETVVCAGVHESETQRLVGFDSENGDEVWSDDADQAFTASVFDGSTLYTCWMEDDPKIVTRAV